MDIKGIIKIAGVVLILASCVTKESKRKGDVSKTDETKKIKTVRELCFLKVTEGSREEDVSNSVQKIVDSLSVFIKIEKDKVNGSMKWIPSEKDKMTGTFEGVIQNDVITVTYSYQAEGMAAKEEKIFKIKGNYLLMKNGELTEQNGTWVLKDKESVSFNDSLSSIPCQ